MMETRHFFLPFVETVTFFFKIKTNSICIYKYGVVKLLLVSGKQGSEDLLKYMISKGADVNAREHNDHNGKISLSWPVEYGE